MPTYDELSQMSWDDLQMLRYGTKDPALQEHLAPFEHRAYMREYATENPEALLVAPFLPPGYAAAKLVGALRGRTGPSLDQMAEGYRGAGDAIDNILGKTSKSYVEALRKFGDLYPRNIGQRKQPD